MPFQPPATMQSQGAELEYFMSASVVRAGESPLTGNIGFGLIGFAYAIAVYRLPEFLISSVTVATEVDRSIPFSIPIQLIVGLLLSFAAYRKVKNRSIKAGMRVCYAAVASVLYIFGAYTIIAGM